MSGYSSDDPNSTQGVAPMYMGYKPGDSVVGFRDKTAGRFPRNPPTQRIVVVTNASGLATWTFPVAYPIGSKPVITLAKEYSGADNITLDITALSHTEVTVRASKLVAGLNITLVNLTLSAAASLPIHITANMQI